MKTECVEVRGEVVKILPNGFYNISIEHKNKIVLAYMSGKMTKNRIKIDIADKVVMEMSPTDYTKGRIIRRL